MNAKDRQSVENAKRRRTQPANEQTSELPTGGMDDTIMSMSRGMKQTIKKVVVHNAIAMTMQDFAVGDYGDIDPAMFAHFSGGMLSPLEEKHQALLEGRVLTGATQPALLPSSGESTGTSSSTC